MPINPTMPAPGTAIGLRGGRVFLIGGLAIVAFTLVAYIPALRAGFIWDDESYVEGNSTLRNLDGLRRMWFSTDATPQYYPAVFTTFWMEYQLHGLKPFGYHLVNVLLHAANAILLWRVLRALAIPGAWIAGAIYAVHPVMVESVAWVTERKNVLSCFFFLASLRTYLAYALPAAPARRHSLYFMSLALFVLALLSKTVACSLPAVILLLLWMKQGRLATRDVLRLAPFFILGLALALVTVHVEREHVRVKDVHLGISPVDRVLIAGRAVWFYLGKLIWPRKLTFIYPRWIVDHRAAWQYIFPVAALSAIVGLWFARARIGRGPLVAGLCFIGVLAPALGFVDVYPMRFSFVADHFQYVACMAMIACFAALLTRAAGPSRAAIIAGPILLIFSVLTWRQTRLYSDRVALWSGVIERNPGAWIAYQNLSSAYAEQGRESDALEMTARAVQLNPQDDVSQAQLAMAQLRSGNPRRAAEIAEAAIRAGQDRYTTRGALAMAQLDLRQYNEAITNISIALRAKPDFALGHFVLSSAYRRTGRAAEARAELDAAAKLDPENAEIRCQMADDLAASGDLAGAELNYRAAIQSRPDFVKARYNLATVLATRGETLEALGHARQAVELQPQLANSQNLLGLLLLRNHQPAEAVAALSTAVRMNPTLIEARLNLADALVAAGRADDAAAQYREVLKLHPGDQDAASALSSLGHKVAPATSMPAPSR